jgi:hypothetical protein
MRQIRFFLLMLFFALQTALAGAASIRTCCKDACPPTMCATMGCLPAAQPMISATTPLLPLPAATADYADSPVIALPLPLKEVWTPPD